MPTVIPVRMHYSAQDLWFNPAKTGAAKGDHVVVTTERGTEFGLATADPFNAPKNEIKGELKPVLRIADDDDLARADELARKGEDAMPVFRRLVRQHGLDMKPVGVEFLFGGEKTVFYFAAEDRIDFRDLVHDLASEFHQRIDMRQIGVRDEACIVGGYAPCGQELCCVRLGGKFEPVSIRMAKEQDLPLNSAKISGVCGRLMCCLRYEFEAYKDFKQRAPKKNAVIETPLGKAKIVEYNTPRELLTLRLENGRSFTVALKDMTCSDACCKRAAEQHTPLRPDTVTREALEALGTAEIALQLAELDRANNPDAFALDDSLVAEARRTPRRREAKPAQEAPAESQTRPVRRRRADKPAEEAGEPAREGRSTRRRSAAAKADSAQHDTKPAAKRTAKAPGDETSAASSQTSRRQAQRQRQHQEEGAAQSTARRKHTRPSAADSAASPADPATTRRRTHRTQSDDARPAAREQGKAAAKQPTRGSSTSPRHTSAASTSKTPRQQGAQTSSEARDAQPRPRRHRRPGDKGGDTAREE